MTDGTKHICYIKLTGKPIAEIDLIENTEK